jgi:hypothetical protein
MGRQSGHLELLMGSLIELGRIELALGHPIAAKGFFEEALASFVRLNTAYSNFVAGATLGLGWTALAERDISAAKRLFLETLNAAGHAAWETMDALAGLAEVYVAEGCMDRAAELSSITAASPATAHASRMRLTRAMEAEGIYTASPVSTDRCLEELERMTDTLVAQLLVDEGITGDESSPAHQDRRCDFHIAQDVSAMPPLGGRKPPLPDPDDENGSVESW